MNLQGMTRLKMLYLFDTQLTDDGLVHLKRLKSLENLYLLPTRVTDAGVAELQKELPNCKIVR